MVHSRSGIIQMDVIKIRSDEQILFVKLLTSSFPLEVRYNIKVSSHLMFDMWYGGDRVKEL